MENQTEFKFGQVAFFGRGIEEYVAMFDFKLDQLVGSTILDCSSGPASFAYEAALLGVKVVAADPLYEFSSNELRTRVDDDAETVAHKQTNNRSMLYEEVVPTTERRKSMELFLKDFDKGKEDGRYVYAELPMLPFPEHSFDIVVTANFLFEYSDTASGGMLQTSEFDYVFHEIAIDELLRVCRREVRIYPLTSPGAQQHQYLQPIMNRLTKQGHSPSLVPVRQKDIIGAEEMLQIIRAN